MRTCVSFVLNGTVERVTDVSPTTTLLQWLRRERRLTGTKEGCAEGDCGACTVTIGRWDGGRVRHAAVNACIQLLPMLDGASVTTVEGVSRPNEELHPCQQAMVDEHGSQCGFCTPGFVMSLHTLYRNETTTPSAAEIDTALAGNLCRCTGYGPIVAAAQRMFALPRPEDGRLGEEAAALASIQHAETLCIDGGGRRMFVPTTEDELAQLYAAHPDAVLIAGATDVGLWVTKQDRPLPVTIHIGRVRSLAMSTRVEAGARTILLGAGMTHSAAMHALSMPLPALGDLWRRFAGAQVRNVGTIGGNIANGSPIGDLPPALIALDAKLHLRCGDARRVLPLEDFFMGYGRQDRRPGEFITAIALSLSPAAAQEFSCHKVSKRFDDDISAVCGAFNIVVADGRVTRARIAFGGMAAVPKRAPAAETALIGEAWTGVSVEAAMAALDRDFTPISDARASAGYRGQVAKNMLLRTFIERTQSEVSTRLTGDIAMLTGVPAREAE